MNTFKEVCDATKDYPVKVLAVVEAVDVTVLYALKMSHDANLAKAIRGYSIPRGYYTEYLHGEGASGRSVAS